jgi:UDP-N-acetyl-D-mannosaminuronic acid dehydrogenase
MLKKKICIIGGGGHIGFPIGLMLASKNNKVFFYDKNIALCNKINKGVAPYYEENSKIYISKFKKNYVAGYNVDFILKSEVIIICIGTPVNKNSSPKLKEFFRLIYFLKKYINKNQLLIVRSSVYPGTIEKIKGILSKVNKNIAYCPERILQGASLKELPYLPQIISGINKRSIQLARLFFLNITKKIITATVLEAELIKLFSNSWRYINFAVSNEFYMICEKLNVSYKNIRDKMMYAYSRNSNIPKAGFAAGPCLVKDTMQLSNLLSGRFNFGNSALKINENLPQFIFDQLNQKYNLKNKTIGVLGLSFKAEVDDIRDSLSIKFIQILKKKKIKHYISDEYYKHSFGVSKKKLIELSDIIILATPHKKYSNLKINGNKIIIDTWNFLKQ